MRLSLQNCKDLKLKNLYKNTMKKEKLHWDLQGSNFDQMSQIVKDLIIGKEISVTIEMICLVDVVIQEIIMVTFQVTKV